MRGFVVHGDTGTDEQWADPFAADVSLDGETTPDVAWVVRFGDASTGLRRGGIARNPKRWSRVQAWLLTVEPTS